MALPPDRPDRAFPARPPSLPPPLGRLSEAEANERLRAALRDRMEFVSNVSHELRTPLTSMSYALANMRRGLCGPLPEKAMAYIERLQGDVKRLLTTVNDLLDLRQIENGTLTLRKRCLALHRLLGEAVESLALQAEAKGQTLTLLPAAPEIFALADRDKLERVFFNILSNAIKYTPSGGRITASVFEENRRACIRVDDTGIGIPPEALPKVARRYFRVSDQVAGTGLGLSIVREIAELHGGSLQVSSPVPGAQGGTRVEVFLPAHVAPLLVVLSGDEAFIARFGAQAEALGFRLHPDREGIDLVRECAEIAPAHFVLDGSLPAACLTDWICQIRGDSRLGRIPILILAPAPAESRRAEYARMNVQLRPWPIDDAALRALL